MGATYGSSGGAAGAILVFYIVFYIVGCLPLMGIFGKASQPGWAAFVPFYNFYILLKTVGRPGWWLVLLFIPFVNIIIWIIVANDLSKSFGHGGAFTVGLVFLGWIFEMILWLGPSQYRGPGATFTAQPMGYGAPPQAYGAPPQGYGVPPQSPGVAPQAPGYPPQAPGTPPPAPGYPPQAPGTPPPPPTV